MKFIRPAWVVHKDSSAPAGSSTAAKALTIFSLDVHPDDSRIATGGLDAKVRIWSTAPILDPDLEEKEDLIPKQLAVLGMHTGPVLCVRWSHSGRWLASGSDDSVILIWDLDPHGGGKVWGSNDVNKEGWKVLKRLPGHESDVTGLAWSTADRYLASVGLDSVVIIWDGFTLERVQKLENHSGFVKGVCWDPAGEFLATCSDDKSVKIFKRSSPRTINGGKEVWDLEASITKPFVDSPGNTFFRRLSWSPDGAHITVANATNGKGLVYVAAVISRRTWGSEISLVGHGHTVQAVAFNPHIFLRDPAQGTVTQNICSVVALGGDDCSVSVWQTKSARPLIVAREAFERGVLDLSWSSSGLILYACSSDGTVGVFQFTPEELEGMVSEKEQDQYLRKFDKYAEFWQYKQEAQKVAEQAASQQEANGTPTTPTPAPASEEQVTTLTVRKGKNKRRIGLENVPSAAIPAPEPPAPPASTSAPPPPQSESVRFEEPQTTLGFGSKMDVDIESRERQFWSRSKSLGSHAFGRSNGSMMPPDFQRTSFDFGGDLSRDDPFAGAFDDTPMVDHLHSEELPTRSTTKARTLGGDRVRENVAVKIIQGGGFTTTDAVSTSGVGVELESPPLKNVVAAGVGDDVLEARNPEDEKPTELSYVTGKIAATQWLDYLPTGVLLLTLNTAFGAAACVNGTINVYSLTGRRLMPTIFLGHRCAYLDSNRNYLMAVTVKGVLHVWNLKTISAYHTPVHLDTLFLFSGGAVSPNTRITAIFLRPNGAVVVTLSSGGVYSYDKSLLSWVCIGDSWWSTGSDAWNARARTSGAPGSQGVLAGIEASVAEAAMVTPHPIANPSIERPPWWNTALTLGHLESRMHACRILESGPEYKQALLQYAKKIADEGFRGKAEEMLKEYCGPLYWRPGREEKWCSAVCGMAKRDLLKDILNIFARSKTLTKLALDWQEILKKAALEE